MALKAQPVILAHGLDPADHELVAFFDTLYPNHTVLTGGVVDDTSNPVVGRVYFDLFTMGNRTLENREDTVR